MPYQLYQPSIQPGFLRGVYGTAWGNALGIIKDYFSDLVKQGIQQRWPTFAQQSALAAIGAERGIPQGVNETDATYVESLLAAWEAWHLAGTPWSILALMNFLGYPDVYTVSQNGQVYGPSGAVVLPNPITGDPGVPPALSSSGQKWTFGIPSTAFGSQGVAYKQSVPGYTWNGIWIANTAYSAVASIYANPPNNCVYINVGAAGTSGSTPPIFPAIPGFSVNDGPDIIWYCISGLGYPFAETFPIGQSQGTALTDYWSAYLLVFDPLPASWTNIQNPPTGGPTPSSPSLFEINAIAALVSSFNAGYAVCAGFYAAGNGSRVGFGWPVGRTFHGDAGIPTAPTGAGVEPWTLFWRPLFAWSAGSQVIPTSPNGYWYKCTTNGAGGAVEPAVWTCEGTTQTFLTGTGAPVNLGTVFQFVSQ